LSHFYHKFITLKPGTGNLNIKGKHFSLASTDSAHPRLNFFGEISIFGEPLPFGDFAVNF